MPMLSSPPHVILLLDFPPLPTTSFPYSTFALAGEVETGRVHSLPPTAMPYPFTLPTTSHLDLASCLSSSSHPSLPIAATTQRNGLRNALKSHKRLPPAARASDLISVLSSLTSYLPYIHTLALALDQRLPNGEHIQVALTAPLLAEWRPTLSASPPGLSLPSRTKIGSLQADLLFTLLALAQTYYLLARSSLQSLHAAHTSRLPPTTEQQTTAISAAMKYYLQAQSIFAYAASLPAAANTSSAGAPNLPADIQPATLDALAYLSLAEATLLSTAAQDPYPLLAATAVNPHDREWMVAAPAIPKVRAHLFARLCVAAADHAQHALAAVGPATTTSTHLDDALAQYCAMLARSCRARAARFLGVDADAQGRTGEAIGWLLGALGLLQPHAAAPDDAAAPSTASPLARLRGSWTASRTARREDKALARDGEWGAQSPLREELRVCQLLRAKWEHSNDTVGVQRVEEPRALMASLPTGREWHTPETWAPAGLGADVLGRVRAPAPARTGLDRGEESSGDEVEGAAFGATPGAWPGGGGEERVESRAAYY